MNKWLSSPINAYVDMFGVSRNPVVYEVGSRDGKDGEELAARIYDGQKLWSDSTVVLFECNPPQQAVIRTNYPTAILIEDAISDKTGTSAFLQIDGDINHIGSSSMDLNRVNYPWVQKTSTIEVKTRRLDDVIEELGHQNTEIDIMKIDIEGYTWEALQSLGKYLRNVRVFHLETEIAGHARYKTNIDVALFMQKNGYTCIALENEWGETIQDQTWRRNNA